MNIILYYVHDPMCSWCWGFTNALNGLLNDLPKEIEVHRLLGGLAADSDLPMPTTMQEQIKSNWSRIEDTIPGVKFNFNFWSECQPRRSTYPACRAVIAARQQGEKYDVLMTKAIQNAYYKQAHNPSDNNTLIKLASKLSLSVDRFKKDLTLDKTKVRLLEEIGLSRELNAESFPNLVLKVRDEIFSIPINYNNSQLMLKDINNIIENKLNS